MALNHMFMHRCKVHDIKSTLKNERNALKVTVSERLAKNLQRQKIDQGRRQRYTSRRYSSVNAN